MISAILLRKLIERNILAVRSEVDATYRGVSIGGTENVQVRGTFLILGIRDLTTRFEFDAADVIDGRRRIIRGENIYMIDGMDISRLAETFGMTTEGTANSPRKRRGRRPNATPEGA